MNGKQRGHTPTVTTVTCAFTAARWDTTVAALESIRRQTLTPDEMILVVDHNDDLLGRARSHFVDVRVVANSHSRGASGAKNTGGELAFGEIVAFLDDDAQATPTWLERLVASFEDERVAGVGGAAMPLWPRGRPVWFPPEFYWVLGCSYVGLPETRAAVRNLMGTNMSVRKAVIIAVNGFREGLGNVVLEDEGASARSKGSTGGDTEFCIRVSQSSATSLWIYDPSAVVYHMVAPGRATLRYFLSRCWLEGRGKAALVRLTGSSQALASERSYIRSVIPMGILAGLRDTLKLRSLGGVRRSGSLTAGVAVVGISYAIHRLRRYRQN